MDEINRQDDGSKKEERKTEGERDMTERDRKEFRGEIKKQREKEWSKKERRNKEKRQIEGEVNEIKRERKPYT
jgi:hypothetical protein